jgi:alpha-amylase
MQSFTFYIAGIFLPLSFSVFMACSTPAGKEAAAKSLLKTPPPTPDWAANAVLYECNVRQFSEAGNLQAVTDALPRLKELGVDIIWLMPIHPIGVKNRKGTLGSPYSVRDYYAIHPDYGSLQDMQRLVTTAHGLGLKVIMDWVPNHTAWDAVWMKQHPEYYTRYKGAFTVPLNERGEPIADWSDVVDLDYNNPDLRKAMIKAMQYWIKTCDIDGYRVDMSGLAPNDFWLELRPALDSLKPVFLLSEWQDEPNHFLSAFNANYGWKWKDVTKNIWAGKSSARSLDSLLEELDTFYPEGYYQLYFTQNHDENTWAGTDADLYGASADAFAVLAFTWQGIPMIYNGQEDHLVQQLGFFNQTPIRWKQYARSGFFQTLCGLRHRNSALWSGNAGGRLQKIPTGKDEQVYAFVREKNGDRVIVVLNLSKDLQHFTLELPEKHTGPYADVFGQSTIQVGSTMQLSLKPWAYLVLSNK